MLHIFQAKGDRHQPIVQDLFQEYMVWNHAMINREFGVSFDVNAVVEQDMATLQKFMPPQGRLLLAQWNDEFAGCGCLRQIEDRVGEVKRLYVRPDCRRQGVGRELLSAIIQEAKDSGYSKLRLDCAPYLSAALTLYQTFGFQSIAPYDESELPKEYHFLWTFWELNLV